MPIPISTLYLILLVLLLVKLTANVIKYRRSEKIGIGDGGNKDLQVAIRAHANAIEMIPICVLLLIAAELNGAHKIALHSFGAALVICRVMHAWGFQATKGGYSKGRFFGMVINFLVMIGLCVVNAIAIWPKLF